VTTVCAKQQFGMKLWFCGRHDAEDNGKWFVVRADEKLTVFLELERVSHESLRFSNAE
jgi:hypothetical protein